MGRKKRKILIVCILCMTAFAVRISAEEEFDTDAEIEYSYNEDYDEFVELEEIYSEGYDSDEVFYDEEYDEYFDEDEDETEFISDEHKAEEKEEVFDTIAVFVNSERIWFDVEPAIMNDRTMVPMRGIFEALGAIVGWNDLTKTATGAMTSYTVNITVGEKYIHKNNTIKEIDTPAVIVDGRMLVPARAIAESFDCEVKWDSNTRRVDIIR